MKHNNCIEIYGFCDYNTLNKLFITLQQLQDFLDNILKLFRYYSELQKILYQNNLLQGSEIKLKLIFESLRSKNFISSVPLLVNSKFTETNINIIQATLIIYKLNTVDKLIIQRFIYSFQEFTSPQLKVQLDHKKINGILKSCNRIISTEVYKTWVQKSRSFLKNPESLELNQFLYLAINSNDRLQAVKRYNATFKQQDKMRLNPIQINDKILSFLSQQLKFKKIKFIGKQGYSIIIQRHPEFIFSEIFGKNIQTQKKTSLEESKDNDNYNLLNGVYIRKQIEKELLNGTAILIQSHTNVEKFEKQNIRITRSSKQNETKKINTLDKTKNYSIKKMIRKELQILYKRDNIQN